MYLATSAMWIFKIIKSVPYIYKANRKANSHIQGPTTYQCHLPLGLQFHALPWAPHSLPEDGGAYGGTLVQ